MVRALIFILVLVTDLTWMWVQPAEALKDQRDANALFSAINDLMGFAAPGRSVVWENPETGNSGQVTALQPATVEGRSCWDFERTYEDKVTMAVQGTACEIEAGLWEIVRESQPRPLAGTAEPGPEEAHAATPDELREAQGLLRRLQYDPGPADGVYGERTRRAILAYERDRGLDESGAVSPKILASLRQDVALLEPPETSSPPPSEPAPAPAPETTDGDMPWLQQQPQPEQDGADQAAEEELPWLKPKGDGAAGVEVPPPPPAE